MNAPTASAIEAAPAAAAAADAGPPPLSEDELAHVLGGLARAWVEPGADAGTLQDLAGESPRGWGL